MRLTCLTTTFADCEVFEEFDPQDEAGDEFACLEEHDCIDPLGHLFLTSCNVTRCVHCGKIVAS